MAGASKGDAGARGGPSKPGGGPARPGRWLQTHGRDLKFLVLFTIFLGTFYAIGFLPFMQKTLFPGYLSINARGALSLLQLFGEDATAHDKTVTLVRNSVPYPITIERGCDAIQPSALFCAAVLASPVALGARLFAVFAGTSLLMVLNFVRILSLCYIRAYWPTAFDVMHLDVWQALFIFFAILLWALWASWQSYRSRAKTDASATGHS